LLYVVDGIGKKDVQMYVDIVNSIVWKVVESTNNGFVNKNFTESVQTAKF